MSTIWMPGPLGNLLLARGNLSGPRHALTSVTTPRAKSRLARAESQVASARTAASSFPLRVLSRSRSSAVRPGPCRRPPRPAPRAWPPAVSWPRPALVPHVGQRHRRRPRPHRFPQRRHPVAGGSGGSPPASGHRCRRPRRPVPCRAAPDLRPGEGHAGRDRGGPAPAGRPDPRPDAARRPHGAGHEVRLLLLSQDTLELHPTGGFIGSYGVLQFFKGTARLETFQATEDLVQPSPTLPGPEVLDCFAARAAETWTACWLSPTWPLPA